MTPPILITAPAEPVVPLNDLKAHLVVEHSHHDALIAALEASAVAHLDGWHGVLGRAIKAQVWRQEFVAGEVARLLLPDVTAITVTALDAAGEAVHVEAELKTAFRGPYLDVTGSYATLRVDFTCAMPATRLPAAQAVVKLLVAHWYANREAVVTNGNVVALPMAVSALVTAMRWTSV